MIFYFSGTGNSLWTARKLAEALGESAANIKTYRNSTSVTCDDDVVGFVFPTYMNDLPWVAKEFLLKLEVQPDCYAFVVMTSNRGASKNAASNLDATLVASGARLTAAFDLSMPGNCIQSSREENAARLERAPEGVAAIAREVQKRTANFISSGKMPKPDYVKSSFYYGTRHWGHLNRMKKFRITDACDGCGICARVCPLNNIGIRDGAAVHGDECCACYACFHWCPQHATRLTTPGLKNRFQYHHPEVTLEDLQA